MKYRTGQETPLTVLCDDEVIAMAPTQEWAQAIVRDLSEVDQLRKVLEVRRALDSKAAKPKPIPVVVGILVDRAGRYIIGKRGPGCPNPGYWCLPGGRVEAGESNPEALVREISEELAIPPYRITVHDWQHTFHAYFPHGFFELQYYTCATSGIPKPTEELVEVRSVALADLLTFPLEHSDKTVVQLLRYAQVDAQLAAAQAKLIALQTKVMECFG